MNLPKVSVLIFSFLLAFCSLFYELVYAQVLSVCIGGTKTQYLITISLFTFALGMGSLLFNRFIKTVDKKVLFFRIELMLIILGSVGPFFIAWLLQAEKESSAFLNFKIYFSYFFIFLIGLLSGFELPCLFSLLKDSHGKILAWDYMGMLCASVMFPFVFLPYLGSAAGTLFVANINVMALIWLKFEKLPGTFRFVLPAGNGFLFFVIFYFREEINSLLSGIYLGLT